MCERGSGWTREQIRFHDVPPRTSSALFIPDSFVLSPLSLCAVEQMPLTHQTINPELVKSPIHRLWITPSDSPVGQQDVCGPERLIQHHDPLQGLSQLLVVSLFIALFIYLQRIHGINSYFKSSSFVALITVIRLLNSVLTWIFIPVEADWRKLEDTGASYFEPVLNLKNV